MKNQAEVLAIIPARGGSQGIVNKNIKLLGKRPLIAYTIEAVQKAKLVNRLIVSTDSPKIAQIAKKYGAEAPFLRPKNLAGAKSPVILSFQHALKYLEKKEHYRPDIILCLQPTSPFRRAEQIDQAVKILAAHKQAESVVSVIKVPHCFLPEKLMIKKGRYLKPDKLSQKGLNLNRQGLNALYARNGPSILAVRRSLLIKGCFYSRKTLALIMEKGPESLDIDDKKDWQLAQAFLSLKKCL